MAENKKKAVQLGKTELINRAFERIKENSEKKILKSQLTEGVEAFLQEIEVGLQEGTKIILKDNFSLSVSLSKETVKNNPRDRKQKLVIPAQKRIKFRASDNWKKSLNPVMKATSDLKKAKKVTDLEAVYQSIRQHEIYNNANNKNRIDGVYDNCLTNLRKTG